MVLRPIQNKSGVIMVLVTMMVIVMSIVMVGLIGRNFSFVLSSEEQLRHIEAEQVAKGAFWKAYQANMAPVDFNQTIDGREYRVHYTVTSGGGTWGSANQINVQIDY